MAFGSYDESEQEQPGDNDQEETGEPATEWVKGGEDEDGEDSVEESSIEDMMGHL